MIKFVYKILPAFIIRNNTFVPKHFTGIALWMFVLIRRDIKLNEGMLQHELVHVRQQYRWPFIYGLLYYLSQTWRVKFEVEAYKKTIEYNKRTPRSIAKNIVKSYKITKFSEEQIYKLLTEKEK